MTIRLQYPSDKDLLCFLDKQDIIPMSISKSFFWVSYRENNIPTAIDIYRFKEMRFLCFGYPDLDLGTLPYLSTKVSFPNHSYINNTLINTMYQLQANMRD